ncbi:g11583 [Coccomyxa elongata]
MASTEANPPWVQQQENAGAIVAAKSGLAKRDAEDTSEDEGSESEDEMEYPPGPICAEKCTLGGPGYTGGAAKSTVSFFVTVKDERGTRIREGGAYLVATIRPGNAARAAGADVVTATVKDNNDGTYTATYSVAARGDYELSVEVNGSPIGGSPFPVFFSPPEAAAAEQPNPASAATEQPPSIVDSAVAASNALDAALMSTANAALALQPPSLLGPPAHEAGVQFPVDAEVLDRTLLVGNLNPVVTLDQIRQLFAFCGSVTNVVVVGNKSQYALVEYATAQEAGAASAMNGMQVVDRAIAVEQAAIAAKSKEKGTANPYAAIKAAHLQQVMLAQMQQAQLAAQVAAMRVQAKTNPTSMVAPGAPQNSASQKAAALSAIAALSKRLAGSGPALAKAPERSVSPSKLKRRREVSPTIRKRPSPVRRRRSPSPPRRRRDASRDRLQDRGRDRERERDRSHSKRARSERRDRDDEPKRARSERRDRDRDDGRKREQRDADRDDRGRREDRDRDGRDRRDKDRERSGKDRRDREQDGTDKDREHRFDVDRRGDSRKGDRSGRTGEGRREDRNDGIVGSKTGQKAEVHGHGDRHKDRSESNDAGKVAAAAEDDEEAKVKQRRAEEARRLRKRALEALNASSTPHKTVPEEANAPAPVLAAEVTEAAPAAAEVDAKGRADAGTEQPNGGERTERKRSRSPSPSAADADDRQERRKEKHHKKHKKHKKQHRHKDREENEAADERRSGSE